MLPLLMMFTAAVADSPAVAMLPDPAAERCRAALAQKLDLKIDSVAVERSSRDKGWKVIRGSFSGYRPPVPPAAGMAAPLHVISVRYTFGCWIKGSSVTRVRVHKTPQ